MKSPLIAFVSLSLAFAVALPSFAAKEDKKKGGSHPIVAGLQKQLDGAGLDDEAKKKTKTLLDEYDVKLKEAQKKSDSVLTKEQQAAAKEAKNQAKTDGKKGKEAVAAVEAALKLTDEQKKTQGESQGQIKTLSGELRKSLTAALTPEQAEKAGLNAKKKKKDA